MVRERMIDTCTQIMDNEDHHIVLAVSHAGACLQFLGAWQDPTDELKKGFPNCSVFRYEYENREFTLMEVFRPIF